MAGQETGQGGGQAGDCATKQAFPATLSLSLSLPLPPFPPSPWLMLLTVGTVAIAANANAGIVRSSWSSP